VQTIFNDENLMYDSDDDDSDWFDIAREARYKRCSSCPAFETILSKIEWQDDGKDNQGIIAAVLNENADGKEVDKLALRAQTVAYDVKVQQEYATMRERAALYAHSHGVDHHQHMQFGMRSGSGSARGSARNSGKNSFSRQSPLPVAGSGISEGGSPRGDLSAQVSELELAAVGDAVMSFRDLDAVNKVDQTMEQMLSGKFNGTTTPVLGSNGPMFLSPGFGSPESFSPVPASVLKTHMKKDRKELPQNRKKIERCNSFPSLAVDEMRHQALSHAII
jgi:hypothetical protein